MWPDHSVDKTFGYRESKSMGGDLLCPASEAMQKVASVLWRGPTDSHLILLLLSIGIQGAKQALPCSLTLLPINQIRVHEQKLSHQIFNSAHCSVSISKVRLCLLCPNPLFKMQHITSFKEATSFQGRKPAKFTLF